MAGTPSPQDPITGACACGAVRFEVRAPFTTALYCHCNRCQRRSGAAASANARVAASALGIVAGAEEVRVWQPPDAGWPKAFCGRCGGHLFSGDREHGEYVAIRLGALDADPGIRPTWRQWVSSAASWEPIPDDGLPRYPRSAPPDA